MKTESVNPSEITATRPSATTIDRIAISTGTSPATSAPKTSTSTTSAAGSPKASSPFSRSRLRLLAEVVAGAVVARDTDLERAVIRALHCLLDGLRAGIAADLHCDESRVTVARGRDSPCAAHVSGLANGPLEPLAERPELRGVDQVATRRHDDHVLLLACDDSREGPRDRLLRLGRLRAADDLSVRGEPVERGSDQRDRDDHRGAPERERPARPSGGRARQPLGQSHSSQ